jgi:hypothetical protein
MMKIARTLAMGLLVLLSLPLAAQQRYDAGAWAQDVRATAWETGALLAGITLVGVRSWDWGSSRSFKTDSEGWFGPATSSGGADKLGHAFASYALTNGLLDRLERQGRATDRAALSAAITAQLLMTYVEVLDGFSKDHGFAAEDVAMNLLGSGLAYARAVHPGARDLLDLRLQYVPSGHRGFRPLSDYSGQKYLVALKLGGFPALRNSSLRYVELHAGYYTRGFLRAERDAGIRPSRHFLVGVGLNLNELLWGPRGARESDAQNGARLFLEHVQVPYTAVHEGRAFGR